MTPSTFASEIDSVSRCISAKQTRCNRGTESQIELGMINEGAVLDAIEQHGPATRIEIGERLGMTRQTVAKHVRSLVAQGLVVASRYSVTAGENNE